MSKSFIVHTAFRSIDIHMFSQKCIEEADPADNKKGTCAILETALRCIKSTNEQCATVGYFVASITLDGNPKTLLQLPNESCFGQRFDEYFNQDGLCSFQDFKE